MTAAVRRSFLLAIPLVVVAFVMALTAPLGADYPGPPCDVCDFAGPPIAALSHGDLSTFFSTQTVMGAFSLVLRAPVVAAARIAGGGILLQYQLGAFACLLGVVVFALALEHHTRLRERPLIVRLLITGLIVANPLVFAALRWGHPEEALGAVLCAGSMLLALRGRSIAAGLAIGLAVATKEWAWLALLPLLIAAPDRFRLLITAIGTFTVFTLPMLIGDATRFLAQIHHYSIPGNGVTPASIWWVYGHEGGYELKGGGFRGASSYALPDWMGHISHPLVIVMALVLSAAYWRRHRGRDPMDILLLLALVFLARTLFDPLSYSYHNLPFVMALLTFEATRRRVPVASIYSAACVFAITHFIAPLEDPTVLNRCYLAWSVSLAGYMAFLLFARRRNSGVRPGAASTPAIVRG